LAFFDQYQCHSEKKLKACCSRDVLAVQLILTMLYILYSYLVVVVIYCCRSLRQVSSVCQYHKRQRSSVACSWMFEHVVTLKKLILPSNCTLLRFVSFSIKICWMDGCTVVLSCSGVVNVTVKKRAVHGLSPLAVGFLAVQTISSQIVLCIFCTAVSLQ